MQGRVVFIVGAPHSGSTLLSLILGSHSGGFALNELNSFGQRDGWQLQTRGRRCDVCEGACPFWDERVSGLALARRFGGPAPWQRAARRLLSPRASLYPHLLAASGADFLVDSSKHAGWIEAQLREGGPAPPEFEPVIVKLVRDGRATVAAHHRKKHRDVEIETLIERWLAWMDDIDDLLRRRPGLLRATLAYERLAAGPEGEVRRLCDALGIAFEPAMLRYWEHEHHAVRGNKSTRSLIARWRGGEAEQASVVNPAHGDHYRSLGLAIRPDERWREQLDAEAMAAFERLAGARNRALLHEARA